jgi:hypothetical protein
MRGRLASLGDLGSGDAAMTFPTEAERQARLHKRAGCDCTEGETMTDPTPEDQFDGIAYGLCPIQHAPAATCETCDNIADALRTAVKAEREGCAEACINRWKTEPDITCRNGLSHGAIAGAAAIRARGESE